MQCNTRLIMDGPWKLLWPCLLIWPINEAVLGFAWIHNTTGMLVARPICHLAILTCPLHCSTAHCASCACVQRAQNGCKFQGCSKWQA